MLTIPTTPTPRRHRPTGSIGIRFPRPPCHRRWSLGLVASALVVPALAVTGCAGGGAEPVTEPGIASDADDAPAGGDDAADGGGPTAGADVGGDGSADGAPEQESSGGVPPGGTGGGDGWRELADPGAAAAVDPVMVAGGTALVGSDCEPGAGYDVEHLPDLLVEPEVIPALTIDEELVAGSVVPAVEIPGITVPGAVIDGGCIIRHDAPAGCFGAVEITPVTIPDATLPGTELADAVIDGVVVARGGTAAGDEAAGGTSPGAYQEQVCRIEVAPGERVPGLSRPALRREPASRDTLQRDPISRDPADVDGDYLPSAYVPSAHVPSVYVESVYVESEYLPSEVLPEAPEVSVLRGQERAFYIAEADVLFEFDRSDLKPGAEATLAVIAAEVNEQYPTGPIRVEGHTDSVGDDAYNQELSEARAATVAQWLSAEGGIAADRLETAGLGETTPAAPNQTEDGQDDPEGRARNRRVVISAGG